MAAAESGGGDGRRRVVAGGGGGGGGGAPPASRTCRVVPGALQGAGPITGGGRPDLVIAGRRRAWVTDVTGTTCGPVHPSETPRGGDRQLLKRSETLGDACGLGGGGGDQLVAGTCGCGGDEFRWSRNWPRTW